MITPTRWLVDFISIEKNVIPSNVLYVKEGGYQ